MKISFQMKKKSDSLRPEIYKALKPYWLLNWVSVARVVACLRFSSSKPVAASSDFCELGNALCLCSPVLPAQAEPESVPKSLAVDLPSKPSITFWNSLLRDCQIIGRGSKLGSNSNSSAWPTTQATSVVKTIVFFFSTIFTLFSTPP